MSKGILSLALAISVILLTSDYVLKEWHVEIKPRKQIPVRLADTRKEINLVKYNQEFSDCLRQTEYDDNSAIACERYATKRATR